MVVVSLSETYDLSTQVGKVGLVGIHTPGNASLNKLWDGFQKNYRFVRMLGCDVTLACASMLPADPLQIGVEAGDIAPQDMFNPILYKAVSNDSFSTVLARMYALNTINGVVNEDNSSIVAGDLVGSEELVSEDDQFNMYYGLLSESGWKKAMPQAGLSMQGLYPIVHQVLSNYGQVNNGSQNAISWTNQVVDVPVRDDVGDISVAELGQLLKGPSMRYPRVPTVTTIIPKVATSAVVSPSYELTSFVKTYVACLVLPPAKLNRLFYRMKVTWHYEFSEPRPSTEIMGLAGLADVGSALYTSDYAEQSKRFEKTGEVVDTNGMEISKIMTATK